MVQLHHRSDDIHAAGAELHVIGNGAVYVLADFRATTGYRGPLFTDPSLRVFDAAGLVRAVSATLNPVGFLQAIGTLRRGFRQGKVQGNAWQQGGALVIARDGTVLWKQVSDRPGDNAAPDQLIAALSA